jgi:SAM-dependent methyltransferase
MKQDEAIRLIEKGVPAGPAVWTDLGAGSGTFTLALNELLGFGSVIFAIDRHLQILRDQLKTLYTRATIHLYQEDFTDPLPFLPTLDGILMANALHYVPDQEAFLKNLCDLYLRPGGTLLIVEYDRYESDQWVPYPLPLPWFQRLAGRIGLSLPEEIGRRRSIYDHQDLYAAVCHREI